MSEVDIYVGDGESQATAKPLIPSLTTDYSPTTTCSNLSDRLADPTDVHRTVLLLGKTGNGKSTLANVLVGSHLQTPPDEVFKESEFGVSETLDAKEYVVDILGRKYRVVDTIGIGDTVLDEEEVMLKLARTCHYLRGGINQILFVASGRFTKEEREVFHTLRHILFDEGVEKYITMVRTRSSFFANPEKCRQDIERIKASNKEARHIFDGVPKVLHVSNPREDDTPEWVTIRSKSRSILLGWLERCGDLYHPDSLKKIQARVKNHVEAEEKLRNKIDELEKAIKDIASENRELRNELKEMKKKHEEVKKNAADAMRRQGKENLELSERRLGEIMAALKMEESEKLVARLARSTLEIRLRETESKLQNLRAEVRSKEKRGELSILWGAFKWT